MDVTTLCEQLPQIARLGFDHGWLVLGPTFLNLGVPVLLVDQTLAGPGDRLGLEPFGTRDPRTPLPTANARVEIVGPHLGLWDTRPRIPELISISTTASIDDFAALYWAARLVLMVGDTGAAERAWSELWQFTIGLAPIGPPGYGPNRHG